MEQNKQKYQDTAEQPEEKLPMENGYVSVTPLSMAANFIMNRPEPFTHTFRTYLRVYESGRLGLRIWHSNAVDSTWDRGQDAAGGEMGGKWRIISAFIGDGGSLKDGTAVESSFKPVTFGGLMEKEVEPGECFFSDEVVIDLKEGHDLVFSWTLSASEAGKSIPYNVEGMLATAFDGPGNRAGQHSSEGLTLSDRLLVLPSFIGYYKPEAQRMVLLGDSITQGVRTLKDDYAYWGARISMKLASESGVAVWNTGSGWGRAYDASADDSPWRKKAQFADELLLMLGVNDIDIGERSAEELKSDLSAIIAGLKTANPAMKLMLSTVPPFNFTENREKVWRTVNEWILSDPPAGVERVFDVGSVLSCPSPEEHRIKPEFMSDAYDPHPNGAAGWAVAEAFWNWYTANA